MLRTRRRSSRTPTVFVGGREYDVDFRTRKFRSAGSGANGYGSVGFDSLLGRRIWDQCMILECQRCGEVTVELRYLSGVRCDSGVRGCACDQPRSEW